MLLPAIGVLELWKSNMLKTGCLSNLIDCHQRRSLNSLKPSEVGTRGHYRVTQSLEWNLSSAILELVLASKVDFHGLAVASNNGDLLGKKKLNQFRK